MFDQGQFYPGQPIQFMDGLLDPILGAGGYKTFFSEYTVGAKPSDWSQKWDTTNVPLVQTVAGSLGGKALRWTKTSANRMGLSWDRLPSAADCEILIRARAIEAFGAGEIILRPVARASGAFGAENGYVATFGAGGTNNYFMNIQKYVAGASTTIIANTPGPTPAYVVNDWVWYRYRLSGTTLSIKIWKDGSAEPGSFSSVVDASIAAAGWIGLGIGSANPDCECDFFSAAFNGETATGP
ncbi:MAG: hypothetical protein E5Y02_14810 [Mesorhizobium sp.]|nr:MAG: hypothetical protein E5Y02_14810 [Mesorhizobium sp.]